MILLNGQTMTPRVPLFPETQQMQIGERDSQSTATFGPDEPEIAVGDWIMEEDGPGAGITWRVRGVDTDYNTGTRTVHLEHVLQTLKDGVLFGDVSTEDMGGGDSVSALQAIRFILSKQNTWQLGEFGYSISAPYEFNGDSLLDAIEEVCTTLPDCVWTYDTTHLPFTINIKPQSAAVSCEMRGGRNLSTIQKSIDRSRMYTRIYPVGADDLHITGDYIEANTALYGVICRVETDQAYDTEAKLRQWATDRLRRHCEPTVTITINGLELSAETGEPLDHLTVGTVCRVPIPELGVVMAERITRLNYKDVIRDPADVTVTLANNREDVSTIFRREHHTTEKASRSGARGGGKLNNKIEKTADGLYTQIIRTAKEIRLEAGDTKRELLGAIDVQADRVSMVVEGTGSNAHIKAASIVASINESGDSSVAISASKISLDGTTRLNNVMTVTGGAVHISKPLMVDGGYADFNEIRIHGSRFTVNGGVGDWMVKSASASGNVLTLTLFNGNVINFSKATTLTGQWSSGIYTVIAKQNSENVETDTTTLFSGEVSDYTQWAGNTAFISLKAFTKGSSALQDTGRTVSLNCQDIYDAGKRDGSGSYSFFGYFDKYGTVTVEGQTYTAYITQNTSASANHLALYRK